MLCGSLYLNELKSHLEAEFVVFVVIVGVRKALYDSE